VDRQGDGFNASTRFIVNKSLQPLGNKVRKGFRKASSQHEKLESQLREYT
jgi:hypothetical protein